MAEKEIVWSKLTKLQLANVHEYYVHRNPLYYDEVLRFTQKNVVGLGINPINLLSLKRVQKKTH